MTIILLIEEIEVEVRASLRFHRLEIVKSQAVIEEKTIENQSYHLYIALYFLV
jgi:hypothetical protein